jgi:hypothetical protein
LRHSNCKLSIVAATSCGTKKTFSSPIAATPCRRPQLVASLEDVLGHADAIPITRTSAVQSSLTRERGAAAHYESRSANIALALRSPMHRWRYAQLATADATAKCLSNFAASITRAPLATAWSLMALTPKTQQCLIWRVRGVPASSVVSDC